MRTDSAIQLLLGLAFGSTPTLTAARASRYTTVASAGTASPRSAEEVMG
jgi:hypothetical protein